ncbi:DUF1643 domain-containing protein [Cryobacterium sp. TMT1-2-2]|uniref:DUF1643 domain-containing protein n=1 Tax=Cryobacterium sp. TMT1-2-2 TaxID=1259233 RepID=UPI00106A37C1|nr:DUF1643 domain-containing protein [Cryobacterium sp. TMT1-2-2]TFD12862.1 DUF1643 domain-containing protein [Cryobacterium sp. TMT1-2-2]
MIKYPMGQEPDFWEPNPGVPPHRFALGNVANVAVGTQPLVVIGMNPSHAKESEADRTVKRVIEASEHHGYTGWVMLNLYPERSPKPSKLSSFDPALSALNCAAIEQVLVHHGATEVLGAWGNMPHATLKRAKTTVQAMLDRSGVRVFTWDLLTNEGNPRHPSPPGPRLPMLGPKVYLS